MTEPTQDEALEVLADAAVFEGTHKAALDLCQLLKRLGSIYIYPDRADDSQQAGICAAAFEAAAIGLAKVERRDYKGREFWVCMPSE